MTVCQQHAAVQPPALHELKMDHLVHRERTIPGSEAYRLPADDPVRDEDLEAVEQTMSADGIVKHVLWQMRRFAGLQERADDLTMVAIKAL